MWQMSNSQGFLIKIQLIFPFAYGVSESYGNGFERNKNLDLSSEYSSLLRREHHMKSIKLDSARFRSCETRKMFLLLFTPRMVIQENQRKKKIFQNLHKVQVVLNLHAYLYFHSPWYHFHHQWIFTSLHFHCSKGYFIYRP